MHHLHFICYCESNFKPKSTYSNNELVHYFSMFVVAAYHYNSDSKGEPAPTVEQQCALYDNVGRCD